ncbi:nucleotidyltransferase [Sphingomonas panacis]|uniref:Nucleotidyltransferase n=1 Tax=Sphingomonas panacis TaxID=1560345 RepID=A0A1B3ZCW2_9SPHN|nr:nucleotidyltransferase and HEPN domain-containing protein [Sphingomonas panacis]AOH85260.1 nucleotidyltransferase [Sphingomonas panacis]
MTSELDHLPDRKRRDLERAVQILFAEFEDAIVLTTQKWKKQGRILKVILYGSYARGDWVEDPVGGYFSDYDLLVVVSDQRLTDTVDYWAKADDHLTREVTIARTISAPVNFIVHGFEDVNDQLQRGRSFFIDVVEQGIVLYEAEGHPFAKPKPLTPEAALIEARANFDQWFPKSLTALKGANFYVAEGDNNDAAFLMHQTVERLYHCVLLVLTLYSPKSHKLNFLRGQAEDLVPALIEAWPRATKTEQRCFELLRQAYVNARYSPHYTITREQLDWIAEGIERLQSLVRDACEQRLAGLAEAA